MTGSTILGITYGIDVKPKDDPFVLLAEKALHSMAAVGNVGAYMGTFSCMHPRSIPLNTSIVDFLPIREYNFLGTSTSTYQIKVKYLPGWAPGAKFKREAAEWRKSVVDMFERPFQFVKEAMVHPFRCVSQILTAHASIIIGERACEAFHTSFFIN